MSLRTCIRIIPPLLRHFENNNILFIQTNKIGTKLGLLNTHNLTKTIHARYLFNDASKKEVISEDRQRIYYGMLTPQVRTVKWFSLTTSIAGLIAQPFIYNELSHMQNIPLIVAACSFVGFFTFITPLLLHFVTKKYITHLDYNTEKGTYIASTVNFFCMLKETEFTPEDVKVPEIPGMFTTFEAKGKAMFLEARLFEDPSHYARIMGYDKPIDFKLYEDEDDNAPKK